MPLEVLIIDNNSNNGFRTEPYFKEFSRLSIVRIVMETNQGLTPARLRGIQEAKGDVLVFVDDDNILKQDFFRQGNRIAEECTHIGAWGGKIVLTCEKEPEPWAFPYLGLLAKRDIDKDYWSNLPALGESMPCGAGMFVRKEVAEYYYQLHKAGKRSIQLDRKGGSLFSGGDDDLATCACDIGLGVGVFHKIELNHYIPASRLTKEYLLKLAREIAASSIVLNSYRDKKPQKRSFKNKLADQIRLLLKSPMDRKFYSAVLRGQDQGMAILDSQILKKG